jgi:hypothetical protein
MSIVFVAYGELVDDVNAAQQKDVLNKVPSLLVLSWIPCYSGR